LLPLPEDEVDAAGAGVELLLSFADDDELSFVDEEPFELALSDAEADLRLSVR
jgi:hypothetical protein